MLRLLARAALVIGVAAAGALALIRLHGYDDSIVSTFFDGCTPMPCWQGIRPGVTTTGEARAILEAHPWVATVTEMVATDYASPDQVILIDWTWSDRYPFLGAASLQQQGIITIEQGIVRRIYLTTGIPLGDIWLALDGTDNGAFDYVYDTPHRRVESTALFAQAGIAATARVVTECSLLYPNLWGTGAYLWLQDEDSFAVLYVANRTDLSAMRTGYHRIRSTIC